MKLERWQTFSKHDQLLHMGAAIMRASTFQNKNNENFLIALREAQALMSLTLQDPKWQKSDALLFFKEELEQFAEDKRKENIKILYQAF